MLKNMLFLFSESNASATYVVELFDADNSRHVCKTFSVTTDWTRVEMIFPLILLVHLTMIMGKVYVYEYLHAGSNYNSGTLPQHGHQNK